MISNALTDALQLGHSDLFGDTDSLGVSHSDRFAHFDRRIELR